MHGAPCVLSSGLYFHSMKVISYGFMNKPLVLKSSRLALDMTSASNIAMLMIT